MHWPLQRPCRLAPEHQRATPGTISRNPDTWLLENIAVHLGNGKLLQLFRSGAGAIFSSRSYDNGVTWSTPGPTALPKEFPTLPTLLPSPSRGAGRATSRGRGRGRGAGGGRGAWAT